MVKEWKKVLSQGEFWISVYEEKGMLEEL